LRAEWIAGTVRGRLLLGRRLGDEQTRALAAQRSFVDARRVLVASPYGRDLGALEGLASAQRAVATITLWHLRILAGWLPPDGVVIVRALAAWYELSNIEHHIAWVVTGNTAPPPFELGGLAAAWPRIEPTRSLAEIRSVLGASPWGEPAGDEPLSLHLALRAGWARRVVDQAPEAREWAQAAVALFVARELLLAGDEDPRRLLALPGVRADWLSATTVADLAARLPAAIRWALRDVARPEELWRAELAWWQRVEQDAQTLMRAPVGSPALVIGTVALLAVDAQRAAQALATASFGGAESMRERSGAVV
jgi:hypothetical protein